MIPIASVGLVIAFLVQVNGQNLTSPCPGIFEYDTAFQHPKRWYGTVTLTSNVTLHSLWLNIEVQKSSKTLKNCLGSVKEYNNFEYVIHKPDIVIKPGEVLKVPFYVEYFDEKKPSGLVAIKFNGRNICGTPVFDILKIYGGWKDLGVDMEGCPYKPGVVESADNSTIDKATTKEKINITSMIEMSNNELLTGGRLSFVLPQSVNNFSNSSVFTRCGKAYPKNPVVAGTATEQGQWPWHVAVLQTIENLSRNVNVRYQCSGTLVSSRHVITAAHCVTTAGRVVDKDSFIIRAGWNLLNLQKKTEIQTFDIDAKQITVHPDYDYETFNNDISILEAETRLIYSTWVQPACIWETELPVQIGTIGGWGYNESGTFRKELSTVDMKEVDRDTCLRENDSELAAYLSDKMYCAKYVNGTSKCHNDSGGGMLIEKKNRWYLRGVLSYYYSPELQTDCRSYALFTDTVKHLPWIKQHVYDYI